MKKILSLLIVTVFVTAISCAGGDSGGGSGSSFTPSSPDTTTTTPDDGGSGSGSGSGGSTTNSGDGGGTFDPDSETMSGINIPNDEQESSSSTTYNGNVDGNNQTVDIPTLSTMGSTLAKQWMHNNLPNFGTHFKNWLNANGYSDVNTPAESGSTPGFGGFRADQQPMGSKPIVILVHGNGSKAQGTGGDNRGWFDTYKALREAGWNNSEIYAINFLSSTNLMNAANNDHRVSNVNKVRRFIKAVYAYVNQFRPNTKVNIIAHSLGCTVSRGAMADVHNGGADTLWHMVNRFISIAGGNAGLMSCGMFSANAMWTQYFNYDFIPTCSKSTGFALPVPYKVLYGVRYPISDIASVNLSDNLVVTNSYSLWNPTGYWYTDALVDTSYYVGKVNAADKQFKSSGPAANVKAYVVMSTMDEIVGIKGTTIGLRWWSAKLAGAQGTAIFSQMGIGHFGAKSKTTGIQIKMLLGQYSGTQTNPN